MPDANTPATAPPAPAFTPGPWRSDRRSILTGDGRPLRCLAEVFSGAADSLEQADANCCLVAAAPDLLDALRPLLEFAAEANEGLPEGGQLSANIERARVAIAKAEGRP